METFKDKIYLITGANSGIGKRLSEELIAREAELFLVDKDVDNILELVKTARRCGGGILT